MKFSKLHSCASSLIAQKDGSFSADKIWATRKMALKLENDFRIAFNDASTVLQALDRLVNRLEELKDVIDEDSDPV